MENNIIEEIIIGNAGCLKKVEYLIDKPVVKDRFKRTVQSVFLEFENVTFTINVLTKYDEIELVKGKSLVNIINPNKEEDDDEWAIEQEIIDVSDSILWKDMLGKGVIWYLKMINNQGYFDAIQIEFQEFHKIQFLSIASSLDIFKLIEIDEVNK